MSEDMDPQLLARFAAARTQTLDDGFVEALLARLEAERRRSLYRQAAGCAIVLPVLVWNLPPLLRASAHVAEGFVSTLVVPTLPGAGLGATAWALSLAVGGLVLWRTPALRRRR